MTDPILETFREEARDHLAALEKAFLDLETATHAELRVELIDKLFRHAHSLKGDARAVGLEELQRAAQELEDLLEELRDQPERVERQAVEMGLRRYDLVRQGFAMWQRGLTGSPQVDGTAGGDPATADFPGGPGPLTSALAAAESPAPAVTVAAAAVPLLEPSGLAGGVAPAEESFTVRVPSERLDQLLNHVGELRVSQRGGALIGSRLMDVKDQLHYLARLPRQAAAALPRNTFQALEDAVDRLEREWRNQRVREELLVETLEGHVRAARLLPLTMLTDALRRAVRDLAQSLGKQVQYEVQVGRVLLDKAVLEALQEPLLHLLRNAVDHGLETPAERQAAGKAGTGTICISAVQAGPTVQLSVKDDGRGVDFARVRERLRRRGEADEVSLARLPDTALVPYLFQPGFTTARPGEISGRGVGLDVVLDSLRRMHGNVRLEATSPAGTTFVLTVPVSISTMRILSVSAAGHYYGIPTMALARIGRLAAADLQELHGHPVITVDGSPVRWIHLADWLGLERPAQSARETWPYLLLRLPQQLLAVGVDDLEDETDALVKPLLYPLQAVPGVMGATLRPDGSVQLVLDLTKPRDVAAPVARANAQARPAVRVLVVDDSPITRAVLRNVFTAAGYSVVTANDGLEALETLLARPIDLVVSDVEMPRLNGFDLTRRIKARLNIPVILVTGREREEHRREGLEAGADAYIVKSSFQDESLLEVVEQLV